MRRIKVFDPVCQSSRTALGLALWSLCLRWQLGSLETMIEYWKFFSQK
jgi:hypothetical protein